jgi:hypothetical protein
MIGMVDTVAVHGTCMDIASIPLALIPLCHSSLLHMREGMRDEAKDTSALRHRATGGKIERDRQGDREAETAR